MVKDEGVKSSSNENQNNRIWGRKGWKGGFGKNKRYVERVEAGGKAQGLRGQNRGLAQEQGKGA